VGGRTQRPDLRRAVADNPCLDRRRGLRCGAQRAVRPQRPACLLRSVPATPTADAVRLHRATRPRTVGNPPDKAPRRLPTARYPATSPRCRSGRSGVRAHRACGRSRWLAAWEASNTPNEDSRHRTRSTAHRRVAVGEPVAPDDLSTLAAHVVAAITARHDSTLAPELIPLGARVASRSTPAQRPASPRRGWSRSCRNSGSATRSGSRFSVSFASMMSSRSATRIVIPNA